jgi:hypothetical protein
VESNIVTKHLKLSADAAQATVVKCLQRQPSVEDVEDEDSTSVNSSPKNPNAILEAANEHDNVEMDPALAFEDFEEDDKEDQPKVTEPIERAEEKCSESKNVVRKLNPGPLNFPH